MRSPYLQYTAWIILKRLAKFDIFMTVLNHAKMATSDWVEILEQIQLTDYSKVM